MICFWSIVESFRSGVWLKFNRESSSGKFKKLSHWRMFANHSSLGSGSRNYASSLRPNYVSITCSNKNLKRLR